MVVASGCSTTLDDVPLPGTGVEGETVKVRVDFDEALNLATGAVVKVNGVDSGRVEKVEVRTSGRGPRWWSARTRGCATARRRGCATPPRWASSSSTSSTRTSGTVLADAPCITTRDTTTAPTVEDAMSQASLLVNGGGLGQLQTVTQELNAALGGREGTFRDLLQQTRTFLTQANATTADIDRALRGWRRCPPSSGPART